MWAVELWNSGVVRVSCIRMFQRIHSVCEALTSATEELSNLPNGDPARIAEMRRRVTEEVNVREPLPFGVLLFRGVPSMVREYLPMNEI